jgi:hypothetical protein
MHAEEVFRVILKIWNKAFSGIVGIRWRERPGGIIRTTVNRREINARNFIGGI